MSLSKQRKANAKEQEEKARDVNEKVVVAKESPQDDQKAKVLLVVEADQVDELEPLEGPRKEVEDNIPDSQHLLPLPWMESRLRNAETWSVFVVVNQAIQATIALKEPQQTSKGLAMHKVLMPIM